MDAPLPVCASGTIGLVKPGSDRPSDLGAGRGITGSGIPGMRALQARTPFRSRQENFGPPQ